MDGWWWVGREVSGWMVVGGWVGDGWWVSREVGGWMVVGE